MADIESRMLAKKPEGHMIALRVTAEDPRNFTFSPGKILHQRFQGSRNSWFYGAYEEGGTVSANADSQIGHLFIWGRTREEAIENARVAINNLEVYGTLKTNIPFLKWLLNQPEFVTYGVHNRLYERWRDEVVFNFKEPDFEESVVSSIAVRAFEESQDALRIEANGKVGDYRLILNNEWQTYSAYKVGPHTLALVNKNNPQNVVEVKVHKQETAARYDVIINGKKTKVLSTVLGGEAQKLSVNGAEVEVMLEQPDPSRLKGSMSGKILMINVKRGDKVKVGQIVIKLWANKTEQEIRALVEGVVDAIEVAAGDSVGQGTPLLKFAGVKEPEKLADSSTSLAIPAPAWLTGNIKEQPQEFRDVVNHIFNNYAYPVETKNLNKGFDQYLKYLNSVNHWVDEVFQFMWANRPHMPEVPKELYGEIETYLNDLRTQGEAQADHKVLAKGIQDIVATHETGLGNKKMLTGGKSDFAALLDTFFDADKNLNLVNPVLALVNAMVSQYYTWEMGYQNQGLKNPQTSALAQKNALLIQLLPQLETMGINWNEISFKNGEHPETLRALLKLKSTDYNPILAQVERLVMQFSNHVSYPERKERLEKELGEILELKGKDRIDRMNELVAKSQPIFDVLMPIMMKGDEPTRRLARSIYIRRTYRGYPIQFHSATSPTGTGLLYHYPQENDFSRFILLESVDDINNLDNRLNDILQVYSQTMQGSLSSKVKPGNYILKLIINAESSPQGIEAQSQLLATALNKYREQIQGLGIKRITVSVLNKEGEYPNHFSYRVPPMSGWADEPSLIGRYENVAGEEGSQIVEDRVYRGLEPPLAYLQLDFDLLKNFTVNRIDTPDTSAYVYDATDKKSVQSIAAEKAKLTKESDPSKQSLLRENIKKMEARADSRLFVRTTVRNLESYTAQRRFTGIDETFNRTLDNLRIAFRIKPRNYNEIYVNILPSFKEEALPPSTALNYVEQLLTEHRDDLNELKVQKVEFKATIEREDGDKRIYRVIAASRG
ncbi:MAG: hypothetical protein ACD_73C00377G0001, partial [uncultured bacterium]